MNFKITSYNQIDSISLFIKTSSGIQEVEFKGNNGINTFRNIFNNLEAKYNGGTSGNLNAPKKIVIDDRTIETPKSTKRPIKKTQPLPEIEDLGIEGYDVAEDLDELNIPASNPNEINLSRSNVMNLSYAVPTSGEMSATQAAKLMASQSGFSFQRN